MARTKQTPAFTVHSFKLTPDTEETLSRLSSDASDYIGRTISESAVIRALLRQASQYDTPVSQALFQFIEEELGEGVRWGKV